MTAPWYTDGYLIAIPFVFLTYLPLAWVLIFRSAWANKMVGRVIRITPGRGKLFGALVLLGFVLALKDIAENLSHRP